MSVIMVVLVITRVDKRGSVELAVTALHVSDVTSYEYLHD